MKRKSREKENKIEIEIADGLFIETNQYGFKLNRHKFGKEGELLRYTIGHYSKLQTLIKDFMNTYLIEFSNAKNFDELREDIKKVEIIIENINKKLGC